MSSAAFQVRYDRASDVLYLTMRPGEPARSEEDAPGVVWRYAVADGDLIGVTIVDFDAYWRPRMSELTNEVARRFKVPRTAAQSALSNVH